LPFTKRGELTILDIYEECPPWDWFCWGANPFNPYDLGVASNANRISSNGKHIAGWTAVDGYFGSWDRAMFHLGS